MKTVQDISLLTVPLGCKHSDLKNDKIVHLNKFPVVKKYISEMTSRNKLMNLIEGIQMHERQDI